MADIKEQFEDFRNNTPKHVQWLLLGVAFLIVIILLTLLLTKKHDNNEEVKNVNKQATLTFDPTHIEFKDVKVGDTASEMIDISVDMPVVIDSIDLAQSGFKTPNNCTDDIIQESCTIKVNYKPIKEQNSAQTNLTITWHTADMEDSVQTTEIPVLFNSFEEQEPVIEPEHQEEEIEDIEEFEEEEEEEESEPVREIREIAVPNPIRQEPVVEPQPVVPPKQCSEFAIPGYDPSGRQIGWIKPEGGANYFYLLSDKTCSNKVGKYDLTTGVITSLKDGSKIGTDSDHIGYRNVRDRNLKVPNLSMPNLPRMNAARAVNGRYTDGEKPIWRKGNNSTRLNGTFDKKDVDLPKEEILKGSGRGESVVSSIPYDRTFILRQFKPIPATIVSEVRADPSVYGCSKKADTPCDANKNYSVPVRATVDRNVYSDDGRTIILPTGTLLMGYLDGDLPGPYQAFGRMNIRWYQFIRPDGVEFNFTQSGQDPYSADAQGRMGVPGHGSTDYVEQMVMPILTALVPAAVNMIAPITDTVINQIDLDNNTVVQSGTIRSSEMAKQDIINTWNKITQKLLVDAIDNTVPPFSIAAGTRINVFSPVDLVVSCQGDGIKGACSAIAPDNRNRRSWDDIKAQVKKTAEGASWVGQIRSFNLNEYCKMDNKTNKITIDDGSGWEKSGYDYRTVLAYCESQNYQAVNNLKNAAYSANVQQQAAQKQDNYGITYAWDSKDGLQTKFDSADKEQAYNTEVLGLKYDDEGNMINPFAKPAAVVQNQDILTCVDGNVPDANGCCSGEVYTDNGPMDPNNPDGPHEYVCCPASDPNGDCFPPITME